MKTYALVPLEAMLHETDSIEHAKQMQEEAAASETVLILVKPLATNVPFDWRAARERGAAGRNKAPWSQIMSALDNLKAEVAALKAEVSECVGKYGALADKLAAAAPTSDSELQAIADELKATTAALDAATKGADAPTEPAPETPA